MSQNGQYTPSPALQGMLEAADVKRSSLILLGAGELSRGETPSHTFPLALELEMKNPLVGHRVEGAEGDGPRISWSLRGPFFVSEAAKLEAAEALVDMAHHGRAAVSASVDTDHLNAPATDTPSPVVAQVASPLFSAQPAGAAKSAGTVDAVPGPSTRKRALDDDDEAGREDDDARNDGVAAAPKTRTSGRIAKRPKVTYKQCF